MVTDPANFRESPDIDAYIFDRFAPATAPSRPALIIGTPSAPWLKPAWVMYRSRKSPPGRKIIR